MPKKQQAAGGVGALLTERGVCMRQAALCLRHMPASAFVEALTSAAIARRCDE